MSKLPARKQNRIENYDYATCGAYFVTICTRNREKLFWERVGADIIRVRAIIDRSCDGECTSGGECRGELCSPAEVVLSATGALVDREIQKLNRIYQAVRVDKYCIMPDHIHMILTIEADADGRTQFAPTISRVVKQFKGSITKQIGKSIWQKSFYDHAIRNQRDYEEIWQYIENNPLKYAMDKAGGRGDLC